MKKKYIDDCMIEIVPSGKLLDFIDELKAKFNLFTNEGYNNIRILEGGGYDNREYYLHGERLETDAEFNARMRAEEKKRLVQTKKDQKEFEEYERLKKKFEK